MASKNSKAKETAALSLSTADASISLIKNNIADTNAKKRLNNGKQHRVVASSSPSSAKSSAKCSPSASQNSILSSQIPTARSSITVDAKVGTSGINGVAIIKTHRKQDAEKMMSSPPIRQSLTNGSRKLGNKAASSLNADSGGIKGSFNLKITAGGRTISSKSTSNPTMARSSPPASSPSTKLATPCNTLKSDPIAATKTPGSPLGSKPGSIQKEAVTAPKRRFTPTKCNRPSKITKISVVDTSSLIVTTLTAPTIGESELTGRNSEETTCPNVENLRSVGAENVNKGNSFSAVTAPTDSSINSVTIPNLEECSSVGTHDSNEATSMEPFQNDDMISGHGIEHQAPCASEDTTVAIGSSSNVESVPSGGDEIITQTTSTDGGAKEHDKSGSEVSFASETSVD